ncbi:hypothetical protein WR25_15075 [Diploscapter pachys]|uniref:Uncharacterized protein n=1 Tax=Diploscapter pachys TaxID=2018661 RepID=A0A2A2JJX9_9BILA|nr:hypothetical protein WR25_15075 [Diploscapter pachys]
MGRREVRKMAEMESRMGKGDETMKRDSKLKQQRLYGDGRWIEDGRDDGREKEKRERVGKGREENGEGKDEDRVKSDPYTSIRSEFNREAIRVWIGIE